MKASKLKIRYIIFFYFNKLKARAYIDKPSLNMPNIIRKFVYYF